MRHMRHGFNCHTSFGDLIAPTAYNIKTTAQLRKHMHLITVGYTESVVRIEVGSGGVGIQVPAILTLPGYDFRVGGRKVQKGPGLYRN